MMGCNHHHQLNTKQLPLHFYSPHQRWREQSRYRGGTKKQIQTIWRARAYIYITRINHRTVVCLRAYRFRIRTNVKYDHNLPFCSWVMALKKVTPEKAAWTHHKGELIFFIQSFPDISHQLLSPIPSKHCDLKKCKTVQCFPSEWLWSGHCCKMRSSLLLLDSLWLGLHVLFIFLWNLPSLEPKMLSFKFWSLNTDMTCGAKRKFLAMFFFFFFGLLISCLVL